MKKGFSLLGVVLCVVSIGLFALNGTASAADKVIIKMASEYNDKHPTVRNGWFPWIEELRKKTNGRLVIQFYNPNTLVPAKEVFNAVTGGSVDMGATATWMAYGKFPLDDVVTLPMMFNGAEAGGLTVWELNQKFPEWQDEYKDIKLLWQWTSATLQIHTKKKMVKTLEDLQGLKIIGWGAIGLRVIKALGANPIESTPHDTYLALERGMADGVLCPLAPMKAFKITDAAKFHTIVDVYLEPFWAGINWKKWNSIPDDLKKILVETTGRNMAQICGKTLDEGAIEDAAWMKAHGHTFYVLPKDEKNKWREQVSFLVNDWIESTEAKGYQNAREIYDETVKLAEKYSSETVGGYKD